MQISQDTKAYYISLIRRMRAVRPNATNVEIANALKKQEIVISEEYVAELSKIAREEAIKSAKMESKLIMITPVLERLSEMRNVLWEIINDKTSSKTIKLMAIEKMMKADYMMQEAVYNSGLLTRNLGEFGDVAENTIDPEHYENATKAMVNFGLIAGGQKVALDKLLAKKRENNSNPQKDERKEAKKEKPATPEKKAKVQRGTVTRNGDTP